MDSLSKQSEKSMLRSLSSDLISDSRIPKTSSTLAWGTSPADDDESSVVAEKDNIVDGVLDQRKDALPIALVVVVVVGHHPLATTTKHETTSTAMTMKVLQTPPKSLIFV
jgi:hypothetical protein